MARLTIEDCWWTDPRREKLGKLMGGMEQADAHAIRMWRLAQEHWGRGRNLVPKEIFETLEAAPKLIQAGLAEARTEGVYVRGSSQYIDWLNEKREAGKAGGKKSAERPRNAKGQLLKKPKQEPSKHPSKPKHSQPSGFGFGSDSGELRDFPTGNSAIALVAPQTPALKAEKYNPVQVWCHLYKLYLGNSPELLKEDVGKLTNFAKGRSEEKCRLLFSCFFQIQKPYYQQRGYSVGTFFSDLQTINNAAESGVDPSQPAKFDVSVLRD